MKQKSIFKTFYKHILIFIIVLMVGLYFIRFNTIQQKEKYLQLQTQLLNTKYKTNYKYYKIMSNDIYTMYQENASIIDIITKANISNDKEKKILRDKLYNKLKKRYKRLRNMGVLQLQFHLPNNTSFLRMHKPEKFGDDLSKIRYSVVLANQTKKPQDGFEIGKANHGFRFVHPLFNKNKHIGSVEISFSTEKLINSVLDSYIIHSHFLIAKDVVEKNIPKKLRDNLYKQSLESKEFLLDLSSRTNKDHKNIHKDISTKNFVKEISKKLETGEAFSCASYYNFNSIVGSFIPIKVGSFIPIKNAHNKKTVAYLVVYNESDYIDSLIMEEKYFELLFVTILILILLFSIYATTTRDKLHHMALFDELTNLPNRAYFYIELEQEIKRADRLNQKLAVMFIDLDGFKAVNDTFGHNIGDILLIEVSRRLEQSIRNIDIVARLGGDEFTIVLIDIKSIEDSINIANKIIDALNQDFIINKKVINIGASIGISIYPNFAKNSEELIKQSDNAMYDAKVSGKNCVILHKKNKK